MDLKIDPFLKNRQYKQFDKNMRYFYQYNLISKCKIINKIIKLLLQSLVNKNHSLINKIHFEENELNILIHFDDNNYIKFENNKFIICSINDLSELEFIFSIHPDNEWMFTWSKQSELLWWSKNTILSNFITSFLLTITKFRYLFKISSEPEQLISNNIESFNLPIQNSILKLINFTKKDYVYSIFHGIFKEFIDEYNLIQNDKYIISTHIDDKIFHFNNLYGSKKIQYENIIKYNYELNSFSFIHRYINFTKDEDNYCYPENNITILYDYKNNYIYPVFDYSMRFINTENCDYFDFPSFKQVDDAYIYIDNINEFNYFLHFIKIFICFLNKYNFLFQYEKNIKLINHTYNNLDKLLIKIDFEDFILEPILPNLNVLKSNHINILQDIKKFYINYDSSLIIPSNDNRIIICKTQNNIIHLSIFKNHISKGIFHFTYEKSKKHLFFSINNNFEFIIENKTFTIDEVVNKLNIENFDIIKKDIDFYYCILIKFITNNMNYFILN